MFEQERPAIDAVTMRQVLLGMGKPRQARRTVASVVALIPPRTMVLAAVLGLVILLGIVGRAHGEDGGGGRAGYAGRPGGAGGQGGKREPVKKGSGGPGAMQITPLEKLEIFSDSPKVSVYNFLQNFTVLAPAPRPGPTALTMPPITESTMSPEYNHEPTKLLILLVSATALLLWAHLRAGRRP